MTLLLFNNPTHERHDKIAYSVPQAWFTLFMHYKMVGALVKMSFIKMHIITS